MSFEDLTIVNIDGRRGDLLGAQFALSHSAAQLPGSRAVLFSPERPPQLLAGITHVPIQNLGYLDYGLFILYALYRLVSTAFVLIVQDDGWVLDGRQWRDCYRDYDYIGAPTHFAKVTDAGGERFIDGYDDGWQALRDESSRRINVVMNGGFSLRSRRLLEAPTRLGLEFTLPPVSSLSTPPHAMQWQSNAHLEDVHLCLNFRPRLETSGIRFAPFAIAKQFAFEHLHPLLHDDVDLMQVFGHHSKLRKLKSLSPLTVQYQEGPKFLSRVFGEQRIAQVYRARGYRLELIGR